MLVKPVLLPPALQAEADVARITARERKAGSQKTPRWRAQSAANNSTPRSTEYRAATPRLKTEGWLLSRLSRLSYGRLRPERGRKSRSECEAE
jgi:hypothetical protein